MPKSLILAAALAATLCACTDGGLQGPERFEFEGVERGDIDVERGEVNVVGTRRIEQTIVDRWRGSMGDYSALDERAAEGELVVESACSDPGECRVRYDLAVGRGFGMEARIDDGDVHLAHLRGELDVSVGRGEVTTSNLSSSIARFELEKASARLVFSESPSNLVVRVGSEASARVVLPDRPYRCEFDRSENASSKQSIECDSSAEHLLRVEPADGDASFEVDATAR